MEVAVVAETAQIEFQAFALHHLDPRDVADDDVAEVGLSGHGAQRGELRTVKRHHVFVVGVFVVKRL